MSHPTKLGLPSVHCHLCKESTDI